MSQDNQETYILQLLPDQSAAQQTIATLNSVDDALGGIVDQTNQLSQLNSTAAGQYGDLADAANQLGLTEDQLRAMVDDTDQLVDKNQALAQSYDQVADSASNATSAQQGVADGGGDDSSDDGGDGFSLPSARTFSAAGRLLGSASGGQDVSAIGSVVRLTAALGPFGLALGAGLVGIQAVTAAETARAKSAQDAADALNNIAGGASGGTTDSINKQIQQQQQAQSVLEDTGKQLAFFQSEVQATQDSYKNGTISVDEYNSVLKGVGEQVSALTGGTIDAGTAVSTLTQIINDNSTSSDAVKVKIGQLSIELTTAAVAANDAAAALATQTKSQEDAANLAIQVDGMTKAQRDTEAAQDVRDIDLINQKIQAGGLTQQATIDLIAKETDLQNETIALSQATNTYADQQAALAAQQKALTTENTNYLDTLTQEGTIRDQITADTQAMNDARTAEQAKEADAVSSYQAQISDILAKGATQQQQITQTNQDAIAKIERDSGQALNLDIGNRDAEKYAQDQANEANQLADQQTNYNQSETQLQTSLASQEAAAKTSEQKQLTDLQTSLAAQEQTENQKLQQDQVNLINTTNAELAIAQNSSGNIVTVHENMWTAMYQTALHYAPAIAALLNGGGVPTISGGTPGSYSTLPPVTGTQTGIADAAYTAGAVLGDFINIGRDVLGAF